MAYRPHTIAARRALVADAKKLAGQCYGDPSFGLEDIARELATSSRQIERAFQDDGQSFRAYMLELRMTRADRLLRTGSETVAEIAERVGYRSRSEFAKAFQRMHGITPRQARDAERAAAA